MSQQSLYQKLSQQQQKRIKMHNNVKKKKHKGAEKIHWYCPKITSAPKKM